MDNQGKDWNLGGVTEKNSIRKKVEMQLLLIQKHRILPAEFLKFPFVHKKKKKKAESMQKVALPESIYR